MLFDMISNPNNTTEEEEERHGKRRSLCIPMGGLAVTLLSHHTYSIDHNQETQTSIISQAERKNRKDYHDFWGISLLRGESPFGNRVQPLTPFRDPTFHKDKKTD